MSIEVRIPTILRPYTKDQKTVEASGETLAALVADLDANYAGLGERLLENGIVRYPLVGPTPPPGGYLSNNPSSKDYSTMYCYLPFIDCC